jgi:Tol biopolymer transport system component
MILLRLTVSAVVFWLALVGAASTAAPLLFGGGVLSYIVQDGANRHLYLTDIHRGLHYRLITNFTQHGRYDWSPDGAQMAYADRGVVRLFDLHTRRQRTLTQVDTGYIHVDWSPAGGQILYGFSGQAHIYDTAAQHSALLREGVVSPSWNADGSGIIYAGIPPDGRLYISDLDGDDTAPLTYAAAATPTISPDGQAVVYTQAGELVLLNRQTGERRPLTDTAYSSITPAWSPDGRYIAFVRIWGKEEGVLYVLDTHTGHERRIAPLGSFKLEPVWLPL